jgi:hypothetical protein
MSPANCYRFFRSKQEIKEAVVVGKLLEPVIVAAIGAARTGSASVRLQAVLQEVERAHRSRFLQDRSLHNLVVTAMRENWTSVRHHSERIESVVAQVIADGQAHGVFRHDGRPLRACSNGFVSSVQSCAALLSRLDSSIASCVSHDTSHAWPTSLRVKMAKTKKSVRRAWTAGEKRQMKTMAKAKLGVTKIAKALKRTPGATTVMAAKLGVSLSMRD